MLVSKPLCPPLPSSTVTTHERPPLLAPSFTASFSCPSNPAPLTPPFCHLVVVQAPPARVESPTFRYPPSRFTATPPLPPPQLPLAAFAAPASAPPPHSPGLSHLFPAPPKNALVRLSSKPRRANSSRRRSPFLFFLFSLLTSATSTTALHSPSHCSGPQRAAFVQRASVSATTTTLPPCACNLRRACAATIATRATKGMRQTQTALSVEKQRRIAPGARCRQCAFANAPENSHRGRQSMRPKRPRSKASQRRHAEQKANEQSVPRRSAGARRKKKSEKASGAANRRAGKGAGR